MNYTEQITSLFQKLPWINISEFAKVAGIDRKNLAKYLSGKLEVSEKTYNKIMDALRQIKSELP